MSGLLFLTNDDFVLNKGTKGNILCTSIQGFSLILFYSTQCPHCKSLIPICFHCYTREGSGWKKVELKKQHITRYIDECGECGNIMGFLCYCCDG